MQTTFRACSIAFALLLVGAPGRADVVKLVVEQRQALPNKAMPYEKLTGRFYGELDPSHPLNADHHRHRARARATRAAWSSTRPRSRS